VLRRNCTDEYGRHAVDCPQPENAGFTQAQADAVATAVGQAAGAPDISNLATKDDLKNLVSKDDLRNLATKDELRNLATKDELRNLATKDELRNLATKDDLRNLPTKDELRAGLAELKSDLTALILNAAMVVGTVLGVVKLLGC
jgi:hypothetical protein